MSGELTYYVVAADTVDACMLINLTMILGPFAAKDASTDLRLGEPMTEDTWDQIEDDKEDFDRLFDLRGCTCFQSAPCSVCTHPGSPTSVEIRTDELRSRETCMCGSSMANHDDWHLGHSAVSQYEFYNTSENPIYAYPTPKPKCEEIDYMAITREVCR